MTAEQQEILLRLEACGFAELVGTLHSLRFTGAITLHLLNGQPQMAEVGRPHQVRFTEHPANKSDASGQKSLDRETSSASSFRP